MKISEDKLLVLFGHYTKENEPNMLYYRRVYSVLREAITNNDLPNNCELPATRKVSEILKLSRSTIIKAYELLRIEGYLKSKIGSGYTVSYEQPIQERKKTRKIKRLKRGEQKVEKRVKKEKEGEGNEGQKRGVS